MTDQAEQEEDFATYEMVMEALIAEDYKNVKYALRAAKMDYRAYLDDEIAEGRRYKGYELDDCGNRKSEEPMLFTTEDFGQKNILKRARKKKIKDLRNAIKVAMETIVPASTKYEFEIDSDWSSFGEHNITAAIEDRFHEDQNIHGQRYFSFAALLKSIDAMIAEPDQASGTGGKPTETWKLSAVEHYLRYCSANNIEVDFRYFEPTHTTTSRGASGPLIGKHLYRLTRFINYVAKSSPRKNKIVVTPRQVKNLLKHYSY